ncbi:MAG TPA: saccharopine dehydrogenase NADP-binding domain-containing protein [Steroidobacteraceae bacterium]|nr:saccharopine dehydrogenase NADP-binding domain-containing protein [Steroidobacteraceae bacterium]
MLTDPWLLYGANGYTGGLIAREAVKRGMKPVLAGRSKAKVEKLAAELGCKSAVFDLGDHTSLVRSLENMRGVLNCAGPFAYTARSMMQACLAMHVHYFDITGEIDVFELAHSVHDKAQRSGIVLCPGVGFDVVPTDCLALKLKLAMRDATHLALGFESSAGLSKGTAKTSIESAGFGGRVRRDGKLVTVPLASQTRKIDFGSGSERLAMTIPWGDVSTAFYTTEIPNIEVFVATSQKAVEKMRRANMLLPVLRQRWLKALLKFGIQHRLKPPTQAQRENNPTFVWGEARNAAGQVLTARMRTANGYTLTVNSSLGILSEVFAGVPDPGFTTPALLVGPDFAATLPGSTPIRFDS